MPTIVERTGWLGRLAEPQLLLRASANGRYLVHANNVPFQVRGDSAWSLSVRLNPTDVDQYLDDRVSKGFNALLMQYADSGSFGGPNNYNGDAAFTGGNLDQPGSAFLAYLDTIFAKAAARGVICFVTPLYLGFGGGAEGWYTQAAAQGTSVVYSLGQQLGARYRDQNNIVWVNGGDFFPPDQSIPDAIAAGIRSKDDRHAWTTHWARDSTGTNASPADWLSINSSYTAQTDLSQRVTTDYTNHLRNLPCGLIESYYENEHSLTGQDAAREAWQSYLGGSCYNFYGEGTVWQFGSGWQTQLATTGATMQKHLFALMRRIRWWDLIPDTGSALVTAGRGTLNSATYVSAAKSADGRLAVFHIPGGGGVTIDRTQMAGTFNSFWYDPATGLYTSNGSFSNVGSSTFTPPSAIDYVGLFEVP